MVMQLQAHGGGGGGSLANPDDDYVYFGFGADGQGSEATSSGTANTQGSTLNLGSPVADDLSEIEIFVGHGQNTSSRFQLTLLADTDVLIDDLYLLPGTAIYGWNRLKLPINVAAGKQLSYKLRAGGSNIKMRCGVRGRKRVAGHAPGYSKLELIASDIANTRADDTNVPLVSAFSSWTPLIDPTTKEYGGLVLSVGDAGSAHATAKSGLALVAVGDAGGGGEVTVLQVPFGMATANPIIRPSWDLVETTIASGVSISGAALCDVPNSENVRIGLWGLVT